MPEPSLDTFRRDLLAEARQRFGAERAAALAPELGERVTSP